MELSLEKLRPNDYQVYGGPSTISRIKREMRREIREQLRK